MTRTFPVHHGGVISLATDLSQTYHVDNLSWSSSQINDSTSHTDPELTTLLERLSAEAIDRSVRMKSCSGSVVVLTKGDSICTGIYPGSRLNWLAFVATRKAAFSGQSFSAFQSMQATLADDLTVAFEAQLCNIRERPNRYHIDISQSGDGQFGEIVSYDYNFTPNKRMKKFFRSQDDVPTDDLVYVHLIGCFTSYAGTIRNLSAWHVGTLNMESFPKSIRI